MTTSHEAGHLPRWLIAASLCAALLAQLTLPTLHAVETRGAASDAAPAWQVASSGRTPVARAAQPAPSHDGASCPVCQSLLHASPALNAPTPCGDPIPERATAFSTAPPCDPCVLAQSGHPPRAPPSRSLQLS